jgi:hypothetical protein
VKRWLTSSAVREYNNEIVNSLNRKPTKVHGEALDVIPVKFFQGISWRNDSTKVEKDASLWLTEVRI